MNDEIVVSLDELKYMNERLSQLADEIDEKEFYIEVIQSKGECVDAIFEYRNQLNETKSTLASLIRSTANMAESIRLSFENVDNALERNYSQF